MKLDARMLKSRFDFMEDLLQFSMGLLRGGFLRHAYGNTQFPTSEDGVATECSNTCRLAKEDDWMFTGSGSICDIISTTIFGNSFL